ncbi:MAG: dinitrogenase iron-molybdenum cofactor biosynthesis protein [Lachnospiraceae bacterium]|nr:dinitrogenase iron-molybdenum cofactor biosynthesis protein [Lachnospiraceae bacterium]
MDNLAKGQLETDVYKVAVASSDGIAINQHFGRADTFYIYEVTEEGKHKLLEIRTVTPVCSGGNHNDHALRSNINKLKDCRYIVVSRIGMGAENAMEQSGIVPMELPGMIEDSIDKLITYQQLQNLF